MGQARDRTPSYRRQRSPRSRCTRTEQEVSRRKLLAGEPNIKVVNLKSDMPPVQEALQRLDREIAVARQQEHTLLKVIHGYGSTGVGGDIRVAVQRHLRELTDAGGIRACIFGENWSKSNETTWRLLRARPQLKTDPDLGRCNQGITVILL